MNVGSFSDLRLKMMAPIGDDVESKVYVDVVMTSEVRALDLVLSKV